MDCNLSCTLSVGVQVPMMPICVSRLVADIHGNIYLPLTHHA